MKQVNYHGVTFGADPEFFFRKGRCIIGAEKVLPLEGVKNANGVGTRVGGDNYGKTIIDGVQGEINPQANTCRANLANEFKLCFQSIDAIVKKTKGVSVDFRQTIKVSKKELMSLRPQSQEFGCMPSYNIYDAENHMARDGRTYLYRSAGGHLHLGANSEWDKVVFGALKNYGAMVSMLDVIVGNTCVLIDRDKGNIERRKVYGRAGEYRKPEYGIEYRTLSNFWLRSYRLMSLVTGLARYAVSIVADGSQDEFFNAVKAEDVRRAINENNFDLAMENFQKIKPLIEASVQTMGSFPIAKDNMKEFEFFVSKGLDYWFKEEPLKHWLNMPEGHTSGWESFVEKVIRPDMEKKK